MNSSPLRLQIDALDKQFILHTQHQTELSVFKNFSLRVNAGECVVLVGPSGLGKSTLMKCLYGNYKISSGHIWLHFDDGVVDIANTNAQMIHALRQHTIGYVSQFLRVIPRVPAREVVMQPLLLRGIDHTTASRHAEKMLARLSIPKHLWSLSPTTFSGGEQQRINIARSFITHYPILLLDEPTASLDIDNANVVIELIEEAKMAGSAIVGIFHDDSIRDQVSDTNIDLVEAFT